MTRRTAPRLEHSSLATYENIWLVIGIVIQLLLFIGVVASLVSGTAPLLKNNTAAHNHLAGVQNGRIDPSNLQATAFAHPGLTRLEDGSYQALVIAKAFAFDPPVLRVPAGVPITFYITSQDVVHGYMVHGTNINADLMPGQVTSFRTTFKTPGDYSVICNEYCGIGHHNMMNRIIVEPAGTEVPTLENKDKDTENKDTDAQNTGAEPAPAVTDPAASSAAAPAASPQEAQP